jgi:uncharacterized protein (TIGR02300 family)
LPVPKEEWGTKRICPTTGKRFYDLNRNPIVSPYTGEVVVMDTSKAGRMVVSEAAAPAKAEAEEQDDAVVLEDDEVELDDDAGDEVLEDDADDNVSLDEIADVADDGDDD